VLVPGIQEEGLLVLGGGEVPLRGGRVALPLLEVLAEALIFARATAIS
jgi:hypothetical protein